MESIQSSNSINIVVDIVWNKMEKWIHINAMQISAQLISSASFKIKHILLWYTKTKFMQDIDQVPDLKWRWKTLVRYFELLPEQLMLPKCYCFYMKSNLDSEKSLEVSVFSSGRWKVVLLSDCLISFLMISADPLTILIFSNSMSSDTFLF